VGVVAVDGQRGALDARLVARLEVDELALEAAAITPARVHLQEHLGPVLRLGAASSGMDGDDGVEAIVLAAEHLAGFGGLDVLLEVVEALQQVAVDGLASLGPFDEHAEIVGAGLQRVAERELLVEPAAALQQLLRLGLILPEVGLGDAGLDAVELGTRSGCVKDSSADRKPASPDPDIAVPARR